MTDWINAPVAEESAARVRGGVLIRIRRRRQTRRASGTVAVLGALALVFLPAPAWKPLPTKPPVIMAQPQSRPAERITIYTSDPDVVIVLVADGGEE